MHAIHVWYIGLTFLMHLHIGLLNLTILQNNYLFVWIHTLHICSKVSMGNALTLNGETCPFYTTLAFHWNDLNRRHRYGSLMVGFLQLFPDLYWLRREITCSRQCRENYQNEKQINYLILVQIAGGWAKVSKQHTGSNITTMSFPKLYSI